MLFVCVPLRYRVSDIVGDVTVSRAKRAPVQARKGQSVPPLVAQDIPTVLEVSQTTSSLEFPTHTNLLWLYFLAMLE